MLLCFKAEGRVFLCFCYHNKISELPASPAGGLIVDYYKVTLGSLL